MKKRTLTTLSAAALATTLLGGCDMDEFFSGMDFGDYGNNSYLNSYDNSGYNSGGTLFHDGSYMSSHYRKNSRGEAYTPDSNGNWTRERSLE